MDNSLFIFRLSFRWLRRTSYGADGADDDDHDDDMWW